MTTPDWGWPPKTCQAESPCIPVGTPGTRGYQPCGVRLICPYLAGHGGSHGVEEPDGASSMWNADGWVLLRGRRP